MIVDIIDRPLRKVLQPVRVNKYAWLCPWCKPGFSSLHLRHLWSHIYHVHVLPRPKPEPVVYGPVDVKCPYCGSRELDIVHSGWVAVTNLRCCNCEGEWGQWI